MTVAAPAHLAPDRCAGAQELIATTGALVADVARAAAAVQPGAEEARWGGAPHAPPPPQPRPWLHRRIWSGVGTLADAALRTVGLVRASRVEEAPGAAASPQPASAAVSAQPRASHSPPAAPPPLRPSDLGGEARRASELAGGDTPSAAAALKASARGAALQLQLLAEAHGAPTPLPRQGSSGGHRRSSLPSYVGLGTYLAGGAAAPRVSFAEDPNATTPASASRSATPGSRSASPGGAYSRGFAAAWTAPAAARRASPARGRMSMPALRGAPASAPPAPRVSGSSALRARRSLAASPTPQ